MMRATLPLSLLHSNLWGNIISLYGRKCLLRVLYTFIHWMHGMHAYVKWFPQWSKLYVKVLSFNNHGRICCNKRDTNFCSDSRLNWKETSDVRVQGHDSHFFWESHALRSLIASQSVFCVRIEGHWGCFFHLLSITLSFALSTVSVTHSWEQCSLTRSGRYRKSLTQLLWISMKWLVITPGVH